MGYRLEPWGGGMVVVSQNVWVLKPFLKDQ